MVDQKDFSKQVFEGVEENANPAEFLGQESTPIYTPSRSRKEVQKLNTLFTYKELFDRVGYGLASHQFIIILFFLTGANPFLVGLIYGVKNAISGLFASLIRSYSRMRSLSPFIIALSGIIFGFSLLGIILAVRVKNPLLFGVSILVGSVGIVTYGELYSRLLQRSIRREQRNHFLRNVAHYGIFITAGALLLSGLLFDLVGMYGHVLSWQVLHIPLAGFFLSFQLATILFFLSGYIIRILPLKHAQNNALSFTQFLKNYIHEFKSQTRIFLSDRYLLLLFGAALILSLVELLGATYYGYIIYDLFQNSYFGGFLNVAVIYAVALLVSFLGAVFTQRVHKKLGLTPLFIFGTLLLGILPLTLLFNPNFYAVLVATSLMTIGASILGVTQGLLARKVLQPSHRKVFFQSIEVLLTIPFLIHVPLAAFFISYYGFVFLLYLIPILLLLALPLYFTLVLAANRKHI